MNEPQYDRLISFTGSRVRALALGVLANADTPLSGYRIAKVANLPQIKVYQVLRSASRAGIVSSSSEGFRLVDLDLRSYLRTQVRLYWSERRDSRRDQRETPPEARARASTKWFDPSRYRANPRIAARYAREFVRPPEKDEPFQSGRRVGSRKRT